MRALLLQALYTVRSERLLMEEIDDSVLYRWFVGLGMDDPNGNSAQVFGWMKTVGLMRKLRHRGGNVLTGCLPSPRLQA